MADKQKKETTANNKKSWLAGANASRKAARAEKATDIPAIETAEKIKIESAPEGSNGKKPRNAVKSPAQPQNEHTPEFILAEKRKLHREIFEKCVEKKMFQEMGSWES